MKKFITPLIILAILAGLIFVIYTECARVATTPDKDYSGYHPF